ncbi:hypothetical protein ACLOJK_028450 [Asimina triloba]
MNELKEKHLTADRNWWSEMARLSLGMAYSVIVVKNWLQLRLRLRTTAPTVVSEQSNAVTMISDSNLKFGQSVKGKTVLAEEVEDIRPLHIFFSLCSLGLLRHDAEFRIAQ